MKSLLLPQWWSLEQNYKISSYKLELSFVTQVEVPDRKSICPDRPDGECLCPEPPRWKVPMSRLSCVPKENSCAPNIIICAFMSRLSCVQKALYPDFRAFKNAYVQTFVRSKRKFVRSKINNLCVHLQTIVRSKGLMTRLSCVQKCLCPDFRAFQKKIRALQS